MQHIQWYSTQLAVVVCCLGCRGANIVDAVTLLYLQIVYLQAIDIATLAKAAIPHLLHLSLNTRDKDGGSTAPCDR